MGYSNPVSWHIGVKYSAKMDVPHYWTGEQALRLLDSLAAHNRHQARTAVLIMWHTGLRASQVLELEWRDLDYSGEPPAPGAEVQEPAGSDGEVVPGAGATLHELAGQPFAQGQGGLAFDEDCVAAYRGWDPVGRAGRGIPAISSNASLGAFPRRQARFQVPPTSASEQIWPRA